MSRHDIALASQILQLITSIYIASEWQSLLASCWKLSLVCLQVSLVPHLHLLSILFCSFLSSPPAADKLIWGQCPVSAPRATLGECCFCLQCCLLGSQSRKTEGLYMGNISLWLYLTSALLFVKQKRAGTACSSALHPRPHHVPFPLASLCRGWKRFRQRLCRATCTILSAISFPYFLVPCSQARAKHSPLSSLEGHCPWMQTSF